MNIHQRARIEERGKKCQTARIIAESGRYHASVGVVKHGKFHFRCERVRVSGKKFRVKFARYQMHHTFMSLFDFSTAYLDIFIYQGCWNLPTSGGARSKAGGQKEGIKSKNRYFEGILVKF